MRYKINSLNKAEAFFVNWFIGERELKSRIHFIENTRAWRIAPSWDNARVYSARVVSSRSAKCFI